MIAIEKKKKKKYLLHLIHKILQLLKPAVAPLYLPNEPLEIEKKKKIIN
jgi:hypothetical protein